MYGKGDHPSDWSRSPRCHKSAGRGPPSVTSCGPPTVTYRMSWSPTVSHSSRRSPTVSHSSRRSPTVSHTSRMSRSPDCHKSVSAIPKSPKVGWSRSPRWFKLAGHDPPKFMYCRVSLSFRQERTDERNDPQTRYTVQSTKPLLLFGDESNPTNPRHHLGLQVFLSAPPTPIQEQPTTRC